MNPLKNSDIDKKNKSFQSRSDEAEKSKEKINDPNEKRLHQPNRPSV